MFQSIPAVHPLFGVAGQTVVWGAVGNGYRIEVGVTLDLLDTLASMAIVWLFLTTWMLGWVGLEIRVEDAT